MKPVYLIISLFLFSCNKPTETSSPKNSDTQTTSAISIFPHSDDFKKTYLHGQAYLTDKSSCLQCHGLDLKGGTANVSCTSCHSYPHSTGWALPKGHGAHYLTLEPSQKESCTKCHSSKTIINKQERQYISCSQCHDRYPHEPDFLTIHTEKKPDAGSSCTACHNDQKNEELGCTGCHADSNLRPMWKPIEVPKESKVQKRANSKARTPSAQKKK